MFASGVCALWDRGGLYHTIRHSDRSVASSASKCDIPQCTRPPELECATHTHTHCPDPDSTSGKENDMACTLFTKHITPPQPPSVYTSVQKLLGLGEGEFVHICITNHIYIRADTAYSTNSIVCTTTLDYIVFYPLKENKTLNPERSYCSYGCCQVKYKGKC